MSDALLIDNLFSGPPEARIARIADRARRLKPFGVGYWKATIEDDVYIEHAKNVEKEQTKPVVSLSAKLKQKSQAESLASPISLVDPAGSISLKMNKHRADQQLTDKNCTLLLDNVPLCYDEDDVKDQLDQFRLRRVNVVRRDNIPTGKVFIVLNSDEEMHECIDFMKTARWEYNVVTAQVPA
jgi:hypothetical protein